jgi:CMP-N-acetylneuraminic acid synthetase
MSNQDKRCSIIIRTRNEERWIASCLAAVYEQEYKDFEVILVDNESTDRTIDKAEQFPIDQIVTCSDYLPGKALNIGIRPCKGDFIVCLSGHCIPVNSKWLGNLVRNMSDSEVAGAYGRQEPMDFSSDADKRDLLIVFGMDRRVQEKDSFFHNANSIIRRELWERTPFDEKTTNIEDRIWAKKMIGSGFKIVYDPEASVFHYHGIHQNGNLERCKNIVRILERLDVVPLSATFAPHKLNTIALIPVRAPIRAIASRSSLEYAIEDAKNSRYLNRIFVSTDDEDLAEKASSLGAEAPFIRPPALSKDYVSLESVFKFSLSRIEDLGIYPDLVVCLEVTFPFRPKGLIDDMIRLALADDLDSVIAAKREHRFIWQESEKSTFTRVDSGYAPRLYKEKTFVGLKGLCCVTRSEFLRQERFLGNKVGLFEIDNPYSAIEIREDVDFQMAEYLMKAWEMWKSGGKSCNGVQKVYKQHR